MIVLNPFWSEGHYHLTMQNWNSNELNDFQRRFEIFRLTDVHHDKTACLVVVYYPTCKELLLSNRKMDSLHPSLSLPPLRRPAVYTFRPLNQPFLIRPQLSARKNVHLLPYLDPMPTLHCSYHLLSYVMRGTPHSPFSLSPQIIF